MLLQNSCNLVSVFEIQNQFDPQLRHLVSQILPGLGIGGEEFVPKQADNAIEIGFGGKLGLYIEVSSLELVNRGLGEGKDEW